MRAKPECRRCGRKLRPYLGEWGLFCNGCRSQAYAFVKRLVEERETRKREESRG
jgi:hypothetical protein